MQQTVFLGIDPGKEGGFASICSGDVMIHSMPDTESDIWHFLKTHMHQDSSAVAVIERVHSMPKQGVASSFKFGMNYGFMRGCLIALEIPFVDVMPQKWMRALGIRSKKKNESPRTWKNHLKGVAQQMFPDMRDEITIKTADALLIAEFCRRMETRNENATLQTL